jgi:putative acetyltransferase
MQTNGILDLSVLTRSNGSMGTVIRPLATQEDAAAFRRLNEAWIARHFALEAQDRRQLSDPVAAYVDPGGEILVAERDGRVVGCVALMSDGHGAYELSKMAVAPEARGHGLGRALLTAAIGWARARDADSLFLGSARKLADAVHLYEAVGFEHVSRETLDMPYARADVFMRLALRTPAVS